MRRLLSQLTLTLLLGSLMMASVSIANANSSVPDYAMFFDSASKDYIDFTTVIQEETGDSIFLGGNGGNAGSDALFIGSEEPFNSLQIVVDEPRSDGEYILYYYEQGGTFWNEIEGASVEGLEGTVTFSWDYSDWNWDPTWEFYDFDYTDPYTPLYSTHYGYFVKLETDIPSEEPDYATASTIYLSNEDETGSAATIVDEASFPDVKTTDENFSAIEYLVSIGTLEGYSDGYFKPNNTVNRAELMKILVAGQGIDPDENTYQDCFPDVGSDWYAKYVCYAEKQGWVDGYPDGYFYPGNTVNKVEAVKMVVNALDFGDEVPSSVDSELYSDTPSDQWYSGYVYVAKWLNLLDVTSTSDNFNPSDGMDRGWVSEYVFRAWVVNETGADMYDADVRDEFFASVDFEITVSYNDEVDTPSDDEEDGDADDGISLDLSSSSIDQQIIIENLGDSTVNLSGYSLETSSIFYEFGDYELEPGESVELDYYYPGETVYLRDADGAILETDYNT